MSFAQRNQKQQEFKGPFVGVLIAIKTKITILKKAFKIFRIISKTPKSNDFI